MQQLWEPVFSWKPGECSEFYIHVAALIDNNNDTFPIENLWNIQVKQYLCCLESDKSSEINENYNKCFYLGLNTSKANRNSTVMDVINNYVQDEVLHEHCYNCKSLNSAFARKVVNHPSVISFFLKRYKGNLITNKCRNNSFSSQEKDLNKHITTNGSRLYKLSGIILHQGKNLTCGHYITVIIFDDEILKDRYIFIYET